MINRCLLGAALAFVVVPVPSLADGDEKPDYSIRSILRKGIDDQGRVHGELAEMTGFKTATSLGYKLLLLDETGAEKAVDPSTTTFQFGQQFRIEIEADSDLYVYVFHEGPDGVRTILMPDSVDKGRVPMVRRGQRKVLPDDGTYFEFAPPPGKEKLLVYASPERRDELTPKEAFESMDKGRMIELRNNQDRAIGERTKNQTAPITEPDINKVAEVLQANPEFRLRGVRWDPKSMNLGEGNTAMVASSDPDVRPDLFVEISLQTK